MTNLESLANLAEIVGAIAVVVSLVYLAVQVRQNTMAQRTENYSRALERVAAMQSTLSQNVETSIILSKGVVDPSKITATERLQFTWSMYELFGAFEFMFLASKTESIPNEVWQRWSSAVAWWLSFSGVQIWWKVKPIPFSVSFSSYVEALLQNNPTDISSKQSYQEFLENGKYPS
tara:strand:- start:43 stop:570 length:528 start_codon:yes stop_codon:yes gene_type:complete